MNLNWIQIQTNCKKYNKTMIEVIIDFLDVIIMVMLGKKFFFTDKY